MSQEGAVWRTEATSGLVFRQLAEQRESRVEEGHLTPDHVHMLLAIPPKYAVRQLVGCMAKARSILLVFMASGSVGLWVKASGHADISSRP
jgi:REP element-mobilizing transposase RayT